MPVRARSRKDSTLSIAFRLMRLLPFGVDCEVGHPAAVILGVP